MEQQLAFFLALAVGLIFGGLAVWLMLRAETHNSYARAKAEMAAEHSMLVERLSGKDARIEELTRDREQLKAEIEKQAAEITGLRAEKAELEAKVAAADKTVQEKLEVVKQAEQAFADTFKALSQEALQSNNKAFLDLAKATLDRYQDGAETDLDSRQQAIDALIQPLRESLAKVDAGMRELEKSRASDSARMAEQVKSLIETQGQLRQETAKFVNAFRVPVVRGRWGEIQLRRVVELAGMVPYCDFEEQASLEGDGGRQRPDMIIRLPNQRSVIVDAKVSLRAYLEAVDATDEETRKAKLAEHASQIRAHLQKLGSKRYWEQLPTVPEFVVAFLPGEAFFSAALEQDPGLIEYGLDQKVILATPTTLIALLKSVAYGWRQEKLAENAQQISALGKVLYNRLRTFTKYLEEIRRNLQRTVEGYNRAVGSLESRVLVSARRFQELGASARGDIPVLQPIDRFPRSLQAVDRAVARGAVDPDTERLEPIGVAEPAAPPSAEASPGAALSTPEAPAPGPTESQEAEPEEASLVEETAAPPETVSDGEADAAAAAEAPASADGAEGDTAPAAPAEEETPAPAPVEPTGESPAEEGRLDSVPPAEGSDVLPGPGTTETATEAPAPGKGPAAEPGDSQPADSGPGTALWKPMAVVGSPLERNADAGSVAETKPEESAGSQPARAETPGGDDARTDAPAETEEAAPTINFLSFVKTR